MISLTSCIEKLETMPDGWVSLRLKKDVSPFSYLVELPDFNAKALCFNATVKSPQHCDDLLTEIGKNDSYEELLSYVIGVVLDLRSTPNGHIWLVFHRGSELQRFQGFASLKTRSMWASSAYGA